MADVPYEQARVAEQEAAGWKRERFRRMLDRPLAQQLIVGAATRPGRDIQVAFTAFVQLRHHEGSTGTGRRQESSAIGVLLTPLYDGTRPWQTSPSPVRVHADREPTGDDLSVHRETWDRRRRTGPLPMTRSSPCRRTGESSGVYGRTCAVVGAGGQPCGCRVSASVHDSTAVRTWSTRA
ncbi:hypothetical protein AB0G42_23270 [Streptomyces yangpuensis]|uniref:hypothetical protein n=1 Tax=Streptomyces TaxID=1883 RepID=UPI0016021766|nr:hypothetical protein [Streptomyces sp. gCLA4]